MTPPRSLGERMKRYETACRTVLTPRTPVILRIDGKAFHTYTKGLPAFDARLGDAMVAATLELITQVQGCQFGYVQSDEISLLVHSYKRFDSTAWFGNQVQKMVSVAAGIASAVVTANSSKIFGGIKPAVFDARAFAVPEHEVANYFIWRQQDCVRNSIQMLAQFVFGHKKCHRKNQEQLKSMLCASDHPWTLLAPHWRYGWLVTRTSEPVAPPMWKYDSALFEQSLRIEEEEA